MTLSKRSRQLFLLLLLSIAIYALFSENHTPLSQKNANAEDFERPTAFTSQSQVSAYNDEGLPYLTIISRETIQYETQKKVTISSPKVNYISDDENTYTMSAQKGYYQQLESLISLEGEVRLVQLEKSKDKASEALTAPSLELSSEKLSLDLEKRFISTDQAVKIVRGPHTLHAVGMDLMLDQKSLSLHKQVRGHYVIN